jgi:hypothetical protein
LKGKGKMVDIDYLKKTREGEIIGQNFISLFCEGRRSLVHRFPFSEDDGDLDNGRSVDVKVNSRFRRGNEGEDEKRE